MPGSPLYFLKGVKEQVELFFTLKPEKKVEVLSVQAERRLAEARRLIEENQLEASKIQLDRYQETYQLAFQKALELNSDGAKNTALENLANNTNQELITLTSVYENVPEVVKENLKEVIATVSSTQNKLVEITPEGIRSGILNKIESERQNIIVAKSADIKNILPLKVVLKNNLPGNVNY